MGASIPIAPPDFAVLPVNVQCEMFTAKLELVPMEIPPPSPFVLLAFWNVKPSTSALAEILRI
ncbi:MAG: hypothetical protein IJG36_02135 [Synergistaceae bacterium]|nr:hypothetical protein [Synergistaceae bacterium]